MIAIANNRPPNEPDFRSFGLVPVDTAGNQHGDGIPLRKRKLVIGRRESCDIVLRFPNVSAIHCRMWFDDGHWYIEDQNSRNGTRINGVKLTGAAQLDDGDTLSIAKLLFQLRCSA
jgi:pSer/pThr/pTyr-binding forkhead associated (FHA) protein